jgi:hypothetical protein
MPDIQSSKMSINIHICFSLNILGKLKYYFLEGRVKLQHDVQLLFFTKHGKVFPNHFKGLIPLWVSKVGFKNRLLVFICLVFQCFCHLLSIANSISIHCKVHSPKGVAFPVIVEASIQETPRKSIKMLFKTIFRLSC